MLIFIKSKEQIVIQFKSNKYKYIYILISFFFIKILKIIQWFNIILIFKPNWMMFIVIYWIIIQPNNLNISNGFILGIIIDIINGSILGTKALLLSIIAYLKISKKKIFLRFSICQKMMLITLLSLTSDIITFLIYFFVINISFNLKICLSGLLNSIMWPWFFLFINKICQKYKI